MPIVPCPPNAKVSTPVGYTSTFETWHDGVVMGRGSDATATDYDTRGGRSFAAGPVRIIKGKPWRPCRPYWRYASKVFYTPGVTHLKTASGTQTRIWTGYPAPAKIWRPTDNIGRATPGKQFTVDSDGIGSITANTVARINTELLVKAGRRQVNWGEAIGESKSTLRMLTSSAKTLASVLLAARKGRFSQVAKLLKSSRIRFPSGTSAADKWLAYQFGWKPLISDVYDSYQHLKKGFDTRAQVLNVSRFLREKAETKFSHSTFKDCAVRTEARFGGKIFFRIADDALSKATQVGMLNPAEVAWALVPFSFVVDWFLPIGNVLEGLSARMGLTFIDGFYSISTQSIARKSRCLKTNSSFSSLVSSTCGVRIETTGFRRAVMLSMPWPSLYLKSPFSSSHVTSALALITQLLKR